MLDGHPFEEGSPFGEAEGPFGEGSQSSEREAPFDGECAIGPGKLAVGPP